MITSESTTIQLHEPLEVLVAQYEARRDEIQAVIDAAKAAELELKEDYLARHKQDSWLQLLGKTGAMRFMSTKRQNEVKAMLYDSPGKLPDFTYDGLWNWLRGLMEATPEILQEACREAFEILTPQAGWDSYVTNEKCRETPAPGKVIIGWMCESNQFTTQPEVSYRGQERLRVLDRVFSLLDGKATPDYPHDSVTACKEARQEHRRTAETDYFIMKMHLNGNLHLVLKRADLVRRLIDIAAGKNMTTQQAG